MGYGVPARQRLADHDAGALERWLQDGGIPATTARVAAARALRHVFARGGPGRWSDEALTDAGVGARARRVLLTLDPEPCLQVVERAPAADGTVRLLLAATDGAVVETVIIPGPRRTTVCLSSQVGCARACTFCETGALGLSRQLSAAEIVDQVRVALAAWPPSGAAESAPVSNLVFMGMGEPFDNLSEVLRATRLLTDTRAFRFSPSRVTVSTVGVADKLPAFFEGTRAELAVSLNAPDDARRNAIMPINRRVPLSVLRAALVESLPTRRRVLFEYVLFDRFNDSEPDADLLHELVDGIACRVNVIPCNPGPDPRLRPPDPARLESFVGRLRAHGVTTLVRRPRGRDVGGACGQLAGARRLAVLPTCGGGVTGATSEATLTARTAGRSPA